MEGIESKTSELHIRRLKNILGDDWCADQLARYQEFREKYSPPDLWCHRFPTTSPIVPLLFQHEYPNHRKSQARPLGYWYGDPIHYLRQLAGSTFMFEDYWSKLPNDRGIDNIRFKLSEPGQFNGFVFELLVAIDSKHQYRDYDVEPLFFDSKTEKGGPDIVLRKGAEKIAIQCKAQNPMSASSMSFDVFQYIFGYFYRLVLDSTHSYRLSINLKREFEIGDCHGLLSLLEPAVRSGLQIPEHTRSAAYNVELSRLDVPLSGLSIRAINKMASQDTANLFLEIGGFNPHQERANTVNRIAVCSISARDYKSTENHIIRVVRQAAEEARGNNPLILAIHLYGSTRWEKHLSNPNNQQNLFQKLDSILQSHSRVKYVNIASNRQGYVDFPSGAKIMRTQYLEISNPYFHSASN